MLSEWYFISAKLMANRWKERQTFTKPIFFNELSILSQTAPSIYEVWATDFIVYIIKKKTCRGRIFIKPKTFCAFPLEI